MLDLALRELQGSALQSRGLSIEWGTLARGTFIQVPRLRCLIRNFNLLYGYVCRLIEQVDDGTFLSVGLGVSYRG